MTSVNKPVLEKEQTKMLSAGELLAIIILVIIISSLIILLILLLCGCINLYDKFMNRNNGSSSRDSSAGPRDSTEQDIGDSHGRRVVMVS